jgi:hypothetical protein
MICLEHSLSPETDRPLTAIGSCAYCGAGVCLEHARLVEFRSQPISLVPELRNGARRILCTTCFAVTGPDAPAVGTRTYLPSPAPQKSVDAARS